MKKNHEQLSGLSLAAHLLEEKLQDYESGMVELSTSELLQIHTALWKEKPLAEYILLALSEAFTFLDTVYGLDRDKSVVDEIRKFLVAFLQYRKQEFQQTPTLRKEVAKLP